MELAGVFLSGEEVIFDCHIDTQILVDGAINRTHPPLPQYLDYPVPVIQDSAAFKDHLFTGCGARLPARNGFCTASFLESGHQTAIFTTNLGLAA